MFIFNKSWITREVSIGWKKVRVLPLFKKGKWDDLSNYKLVRWAFNQYVFYTTKCKVIYLRIMNVADTCRIGDFYPEKQRTMGEYWIGLGRNSLCLSLSQYLSLSHGGTPHGNAAVLFWCPRFMKLLGNSEGGQGKFTRMIKDFAIQPYKTNPA